MLVPLAVLGSALLLILLLGAVLVGGAIWGAFALVRHMRQQKQDRDSVWARWAHARGWRYRQQWPEMVHRFALRPFGVGSGRRAERGFWGRFDNVEVFGFHYTYVVRSGDNTQVVQQFITGTRFPGAFFPPVRVMPESLFNPGEDIQFENAAFNAMFHITGPSKRFAHDVLHPRAIELLMRTPPASVLWLEGDVLLSSVVGDPDPLRIDAQLRQLTEFAGLLPNFLLKEVGGRPVNPDLSGPGVSQEEQHRRMLALQPRPHLPPAPPMGQYRPF